MKDFSVFGLGRQLRRRLSLRGNPSDRAALFLLGAFLAALFIQTRFLVPWVEETGRLRQETARLREQ